MERSLLETAYSVEISNSPEKVWQLLSDALARLKLDKVMYITRSDNTDPDWFVKSTLPDNWPRAETKNPDFSEPFVTFCCATFEPTKLGAEFLETHATFIDDYTRDYVASMARFSWSIGVGVPCCLKGSGRHGGFILGNDMSRHDFERGVMPLIDDLRTFCLIAHRKLDAMRRDENQRENARPLSPREYEVMQYLSQGVRPKNIAAKLSVSEASVRLYIKNARYKLDAATKEEAILRFVGK